jgi:hypothetical protein
LVSFSALLKKRGAPCLLHDLINRLISFSISLKKSA